MTFKIHFYSFAVDKWQEKRKKYVESKYFRMLQREGKLNNPNLVPVGASQENKKKETTDDKPKNTDKKNFSKTKEDFERRKKHFQERNEAKQVYKSKKAERFKILSKKTSRGQPLMAGRIEMLLEKIKSEEQ